VFEQGCKEVQLSAAFDLGVDGMDVEPIRPQLGEEKIIHPFALHAVQTEHLV
jgi:hypothetical protein